MAIDIQSLNQLLGNMIRKVMAETSLTDISAGSVLLSLLEAAASNDYENNVAILNVLELLNIDVVKNNDLDDRAGDYGLTRFPAMKASGSVTLKNTNITKRSTGLYVIKPAPIAGQTTIYVNSTTNWAPTGSLYIGRGTTSFEGPINYSAITVYPTYSAITLTSALQNDHLISDTVIDSQGQPDRIVTSGTVVKIPANNQNPEILYTTLRDAVIPSGEDHVDGVAVVAQVAGSIGNAPINTITQFAVAPFIGAGVTNTSSFSDGADVETDTQLRNRIKSYSLTLARGTAPSIIQAIIGVSDPVENKQVASAVLTEPVNNGDPSILYIDDGTGFQPSYAGQSVDQLLTNANGKEQFLQLANFPLPRPQVVNFATGPFNIPDGSFFRVVIDGKEETVFFSNKNFLNPSSAQVSEIIIAINSQSVTFKARFTNNSANILIYPVDFSAEIIQVSPLQSTDTVALYANTVFQFPTDEFSYINLFQNSTRLFEKEKAATVETIPFASWNITSPGDIIISVDGTPSQDRAFAITDFAGASAFSSLTLAQWVVAFNSKFAGLTATATSSQTMLISSNQIGSASEILVSGGTYLNNWFPNLPLSSVGQTSDFELNRQTGNLRILTKINAGDSISAGITDAKGFAISAVTTSGNYNLAADSSGRPAEMVVVVDSTYTTQRSLPLLVGATMQISNPSGTTSRIMSSTVGAFADLLPGDYIYIVSRSAGWFSAPNTGLFKITGKGNHTAAGVDTYVEVQNPNVVAEGPYTIADALDMKAFTSDGYPQVWRGSYTTNPPAQPIAGIVTSLDTDLIGVNATVFKSDSIKITSTTETNGSIAIPVSVGNCSLLFTETATAQFGNPSHIANRVSDRQLVSLFKPTASTNTNVWLGRSIHTDQKGTLTASATPDAPPFTGTYSETVQATGQLTPTNVSYNDVLSFTRGNNKGQFRSVKAKIATDEIGTQEGTARTVFAHVPGDEYELVSPIAISSEDSIVVVMDNDSTNKTIDIALSRTGSVNSGSGGNTFTPTNTEFSANDFDNEPGIDFSTPSVWSTSINHTDFSDYAAWFQARNWYATGGTTGTTGAILLRASQFGPNGNKTRFNIKYPSIANQTGLTFFQNTPSFTTFTYVFGSGTARPIAVTPGTTIAVTGPYPDKTTNFPNGSVSSGNYYDYTFSSGNFTTVMVGDVLSINAGSGVSLFNQGQFGVAAKSGNTMRVFNPTATTTAPGTAEVTTVTTIADVVGTPSTYTVNTVGDTSGSLQQKYFIIRDHSGTVAVWYDLNNSGAVPPPHGANRAIKVATVVTNDTATTVASKTAQMIALDNAFTVAQIGNQITITETINGPLAAGSAGTSGFTVIYAAGTADSSLDGKYFIVYDDVGSVAIWYDVGNDGTPQPFDGANRSIRVSGVNYGDSANTVAAATAAAINPDVKLLATASGNTVTITRQFDGAVPASTSNTSGFTVSDVAGSLATSELITNANSIGMFPLAGTSLASICATINASSLMTAVPISGTAITKSTVEETYAYTGNSTALGYGHNPTNPSLRDHVNLYDGVNFIKTFANTNPNFVFKFAFTLQGASTIYSMDTAPNPGITTVGELFKLIPVTVKNIYHHFTQKALSQLPIVANVNITNDRKNVQISSKNLGSAGAVEVIGGSGNSAKGYLDSESEVATDASGSYLLAKIPAFPDTFNENDLVQLQNDAGVKRFSRLTATDSITTTNAGTSIIDYNYNAKTTGFINSTTFTITDVSASYGRPSGFVWRWTNDGVGTNLSNVVAGDLLMAFGTLAGWNQTNKVGLAGDELWTGFPVIAVNVLANWVDVVNPYGKAMATPTAIGAGSAVHFVPTPVVKWNLTHAAKIKTALISRVSNVVTFITIGAHNLNTGDSVDVRDSDNVPDATYASITVLSPNSFTIALAGSNFTETASGSSIIKTGLVPTRYRIEKLGFNNMVRLTCQDGASPHFVDCGVAVDDYIVISGTTFDSNNNGRFRVLAVDQNSVILLNPNSTAELNTIRPFNNKSLQANWTSNTNVITGVAGTFKNLAVGNWVKKPEDADSDYNQIISFLPSTPATATQVTLGSPYLGTTATSPGVSYDELNDYDKGVVLQNASDIIVYEGDAAVSGDTLFVQNIIDANWFSVGNIGSFPVTVIGVDPTTYLPFLRVTNPNGVAEANRLMSVNVNGFYLIESLTTKFYSIRQVKHAVLDDLNPTRRSLYMVPSDRNYKFSDANSTSITHLGKFGYNTEVTTGIDGYLYYTGLLQRVQHLVDGFEPDANNFPGLRAVGGLIETLPPLDHRIVVAITVTTNEGVNLGDISNNIKSVIINYIATLGVGQDVVLSQMTAAVIAIKGVAAVTFTNPIPSTERITIASNEKATITPSDIGIA